MSMENMSKADLHKMMFRNGKFHGFLHDKNVIKLSYSYSRTVMATGLELLTHAYQTRKHHQKTFKYFDFMVHKEQQAGVVKTDNRPTNSLSDAQYELALQLLYVISDDYNPEIRLTKLSGILIVAGVTILQNVMKPIPRDDIHILLGATIDGLTTVLINDLDATEGDLDSIAI